MREAVDDGALDLAVGGEHDEALAGGAEVVDPGERGVELAAHSGELLERVEAHEPLGAQCGGDLGVELCSDRAGASAATR